MRVSAPSKRQGIISWGGAHLTTLICFLAFVAVGNSIGGGVRLALDGHSLRWIGFVINLVASVVLSAWALARVRTQWGGDLAVATPKPAAEALPLTSSRPAARRPTWLRLVHWTLTIAFIVVGVVTIATQWGTFQSALGHLGHVQWRPLRWALYAEVLALIAFAQLTRLLLRTGGVNFGLGSMFRLTLASNAIALTLPAGPAWAVTFSVEQLRRSGVTKSLSAYAYVLTWVMSAIALVLIAVVGVDVAGDAGLASRFHGPALLLTLGAVVALVAALLLFRFHAVRATLTRSVRTLAPNASSGRVARKVAAVRAELSGIRVSTPLLLRCIAAALLNWIYDCGALVLSILAVGGHVPWQGVLAAYALTQLAAALPITPGGVGVVEGTLSLMLIACHMPAATAIAAVVLYRIISFWLLVPIGWGAVVSLLGRPRLAPRVAEPAAPATSAAPARSTAPPAVAA